MFKQLKRDVTRSDKHIMAEIEEQSIYFKSSACYNEEEQKNGSII